MHDEMGRPVYRWVGPRLNCSRRRRAQHTRERWFSIEKGQRWYHCVWRPYEGLRVFGRSAKGVAQAEVYYLTPALKEAPLKRRIPSAEKGYVMPALLSESTILNLLPTVCEFLTATQYEDGSPRAPGYWWFTNRGSLFEVILFDPDSGARLPVVAATIDDALMAAELALGTENAPWVPDRYLNEQLAKKSKKKGA